MHDDKALDAAAVFLSALRERFPRRCYTQRSTARPGQAWIADRTGQPPYKHAVVYVRADQPFTLATISIRTEQTILVSIPYTESKVMRLYTSLKFAKRGARAVFDKLDADGAREIAELIRRLVDVGAIVLPPLADIDALSKWRIV